MKISSKEFVISQEESENNDSLYMVKIVAAVTGKSESIITNNTMGNRAGTSCMNQFIMSLFIIINTYLSLCHFLSS